ncbi:hypothetical protein ATE80_16115 [Streptomyces kanasensis]|uniref:Uncharacterized protein n=1 Tax=Streptomyces kanasensis TaxID=936756 RepID=A0A100Y514_9ACTN|nr:hypothetical protein ATE80_16115 [Streptomyces kanasensis]
MRSGGQAAAGATRQPDHAPGLQRFGPVPGRQLAVAVQHEHEDVEVRFHVDGDARARGESHHVRVELPVRRGEPPQGAAPLGRHRAYEIGHPGEHAGCRGRR